MARVSTEETLRRLKHGVQLLNESISFFTPGARTGRLARKAIQNAASNANQRKQNSRSLNSRPNSDYPTITQGGNGAVSLPPVLVTDANITDYSNSGTLTWNVTAGQEGEIRNLLDLATRASTTWTLYSTTDTGRKSHVKVWKLGCRFFIASVSRLPRIPTFSVVGVKMPDASTLTTATEFPNTVLSIGDQMGAAIAGNFSSRVLMNRTFKEVFHYDQAGSVWTYELAFVLDATKFMNEYLAEVNSQLVMKGTISAVPKWYITGILRDAGQGINYSMDWREIARYQKDKPQRFV